MEKLLLDKFGKIDDFNGEHEDIKNQRQQSLELIKQMSKIVKRGGAVQVTTGKTPKSGAAKPDEWQTLSTTCEKGKELFPEQGYYYVLAKTSEISLVIGNNKRYAAQEMHDQAVMPMKIWAEEEYPLLVRELKRCTKAKKAKESAATAAEKNATPEKTKKKEKTEEIYDLLHRQCAKMIEKHQASPRHHIQCLKAWTHLDFEFTIKCLAEVEKAHNAMKELAKKKEEERQKYKEEEKKKALTLT